MHGFKAFYGSRTADIYADTLFQAKEKAIAIFNPPKSKRHTVSVVLCEKDGKQVTHSTAGL